MLIVLRADLVRALGEDQFVKKFGALDYLVVLDSDANETGQMANQVLAIGAYPETDGSFTNFQGRVQRIYQAFAPPGDALTGIEAIARLGEAIDGVARPATASEIFAQLAASEPAFSGLRFEALGPHGAGLKSTTAAA